MVAVDWAVPTRSNWPQEALWSWSTTSFVRLTARVRRKLWLTSQGGTATAHQDSIADPGAAESLIRQAVDRHGRIDILVNNAGFTALTDMESHRLADLDDQLDVHLRGPFVATHEAFRNMEGNNYGRIVFTSSSAGFFGRSTGGGYSIANQPCWG
jgi:NAD(P)-dependent dehydrogenase (short-subunit alcohol dehydrogenase family)